MYSRRDVNKGVPDQEIGVDVKVPVVILSEFVDLHSLVIDRIVRKSSLRNPVIVGAYLLSVGLNSGQGDCTEIRCVVRGC